jgi:hypothetical protein
MEPTARPSQRPKSPPRAAPARSQRKASRPATKGNNARPAAAATPAAGSGTKANGAAAAGPVPRGGVCVLGMHRSGTSLIARVINLLGVDLGSEEGLLPPGPDNPSGYWESAEILEINDAILETFGGRWDKLPALPEDWLASPSLIPLRKRAREILRERFGDIELWGWKDPRNCVTLPFWQELVRGMRYVVCIRNPVDVAESLSARGDGRSGREHVEDWLRHTALALHHTASRPRVVVHFEEFFDQPEEQAERLSRFVGRRKAIDEPGVTEAIRDFVEPEQVHGRTSPVVMLEDDRVPPEAAALYVAIRLASEVDILRRIGRDSAPETWAAVNRLAEHLVQRLDEGHRRETRIGELEKRLGDIEAEIKKRGRRVQELARVVEDRNRKLAERERQVAVSRGVDAPKAQAAGGSTVAPDTKPKAAAAKAKRPPAKARPARKPASGSRPKQSGGGS